MSKPYVRGDDGETKGLREMAVTHNKAGKTRMADHSLRVWGICFIAFFIFLYLVAPPSSRASDAPLLSAAVEDWDETDPVEDKSLLSLSDHQPDVDGPCLSMQRLSNLRRLIHAESMTAGSPLFPSFSEARAPPSR
jgi:hypothetical protein